MKRPHVPGPGTYELSASENAAKQLWLKGNGKDVKRETQNEAPTHLG